MTPCGFILLNKSKGPTTFRILSPLKRHFRKIKVGHAGTLDSEASGLVIAAVGGATRLLQYAEALEKTYSFRWHLGRSTETGDYQGEILEENLTAKTNATEIQKHLPSFRGLIEQTPPLYSAVKINGKRASDLAREGKSPELKSRQIEIFEFEPVGEWLEEITEMDFFVRCSKGTYVRSLGRDLGLKLGQPACVSEIHRKAIGRWDIAEAVSWENGDFDLALIPPEKFLPEFPTLKIAESEIHRARNGNPLYFEKVSDGLAFVRSEEHSQAEMFGEINNGKFQPRVVFQ